MADNPIPQRAHRQLPMVDSIYAGLSLETRGRDRCATDSETDLYNAAETLVRYRLGSFAIIRRTDRDARRMFLSDLRVLDRLPFPEMQLTMQLLAHFAPQIAKSRPNATDPPFEEAVSPQRPRDYTATFAQLGEYLKRNQLIANYISLELARGKAQIPS